MINPVEKLDQETGEISKGNPYFFQFYKENFFVIQKLISDYPKAAEVLFFIINHMDDYNALVISQNTLAEALKVSRVTINTCIKHLRSEKIIGVYKSGNTNVYCVNTELVWQLSHDKKRYAKFSAKVYISESEQFSSNRGKNKTSIKTEKIGHYKAPKSKEV